MLLAGMAAAVPAIAADGTPTFTKDVAPIFYKSCIECHRATMFAPMSLTSYEDARPWLRSIKQRVTARTMPPWGSDMPHGVLKNDPRLTEKEVQTIVSWIDGGAPKGDLADMPRMPALAEGWTIGKPDAVYSMTEDYKIPATGTIEYLYLRIPVNLPEDRWYTAVEIKPSARAHVHHIIAYTEPSSDKPTRPGNTFGPTNIFGVSPNKPGLVFEPGVAKLLRAHHDIILQMHYTTNGTAAVDRTELGFIFAKEPPKQIHVTGLAVQPRFLIPAGDPNAEVKAVAEIRQDTVITSLTPHMHVRGKDMTYTAFYPDGTSEVLLRVPKYDFNWQITYDLAKPKVLPKGTKVEVVAHFDNSPGNKYNPDPTKDVKWGDQTWEEMMFGFYSSMDPKQDLTAGGLAQARAKDGEINGFAGEGSVTAASMPTTRWRKSMLRFAPQTRLHHAPQLVQFERLAEEARVQAPCDRFRLTADPVARRQQNAGEQLRPEARQLTRQPVGGESGQSGIRHQKIERLVHQPVEGLVRIVGGDGTMTLRRQRLADQRGQRGLRVHDEDPRRHARPVVGQVGRRDRAGGRNGRSYGKLHPEPRAP
jgi:hypothetical protein